MKQGLSLGFSQSLVLTPQLQQSIRLLQLSSQELELEVEQQLATNPFLERDDEVSEREHFDEPKFDETPSTSSDDDSFDEDGTGSVEDAPNWDGDGTTEIAPNDSEWGVDAGGSQNTSSQYLSDDFDPLVSLSHSISLQDHLKHQAQHLRLSQTDAASLDFLIDSLDERGFLTDALEDLAASLSSDKEDIERLVDKLRIAKNWLQNLDPTGVGASDVSECLRLQVRTWPADETRTIALRLLSLSLEQLAQRNIKILSQACECLEAQVQQALKRIRSLDPLPARPFMLLHNAVIVPDVFVRAIKGKNGIKFETQLNLDLMPKLKVDAITMQLLKLQKARQKSGEMQQAFLEARGFIKSISQRFDTVLRVAKAIVVRQGQFLQHGAVAMRPLVLRDIADELGLHESTVSRVTTAKYMSTPQGTFEFKYFFDASLGTESAGKTSGTAVRALISQCITAENKAKPLSDGKLASILADQGIECARRTVAKYREAMRIPTASLRRQT